MDKLQQSYLFIPNKFKVMNVLLALMMNPLWTKICNGGAIDSFKTLTPASDQYLISPAYSYVT